MMRAARRRLPVLVLIALAALPATAAKPAKVATPAAASKPAAASQRLSDVLKAPRPAGGEHFGLYLQGKKVGFIYTDLALVPGSPDKARMITETVFKAKVGANVSERYVKEERVYESKSSGRLLSFVFEQRGDGGNQTLEATATDRGLRVLRKRPGLPNQVLNQPPSPETVEDADQARTALLRKEAVRGTITDAQDLGHYRVTTTLGGHEDQILGGVKTRLFKVKTLSEKENVPVEALVTAAGAMLEIHFGPMLVARAEPKDVARSLDQVEVFGLTRIVLPRPLPDTRARAIPGELTFVVQGLPDKFQRPTSRQRYTQKPDGSVEVTITARPPLAKPVPRPLADPSGGGYLESNIIVESDNAEIRALAKRIAGKESDAYRTALLVNAWVSKNLAKEYGASADRATDVLRQMKGDCTEHSLLAVSLLRALGIPARRVDGVVYLRNSDGVPALYWHEWVEAWVGEWAPMDPTFDQSVADATHFALGEEARAEITPLIGQLKVTAVR